MPADITPSTPPGPIQHKRPLLGEQLLASGAVNRSQIVYALQKQRVSGEPLGALLIRLGLVTEQEVARCLAVQYDLPYCPFEQLPPPHEEVRELFRRELCINHGMCPIDVVEGELRVAMGNADPQRLMALIDRRTGMRVRLLQTEFSAVPKLIAQLGGDESSALERAFVQEYEKLRLDQQNTLSTDTLLARILHYAVAERATDIHIQPESRSIHLSFRIDGVLLPVYCMEPVLARLTAAIKVRAGMDIADSLLPQDGRFTTTVNDDTYDVRVSTVVTPHGENVVLRLLPTGAYISGLDELGFLPAHLPLLQALFEQPHGIILMTGPTGSGKTTTLYAGLRAQGLTGKNIITVEDPIEYSLPFATQTQVNRRAGYGFDQAITHFLRHDPDIMLVGEIRDGETAEAAMRAAETGHLVLSTLHVNGVFAVVNRLRTLKIPAATIAEALIGVVNQRLARRLCEHCRQPDLGDDLARDLAERGEPLYRGVGCPRCRHTGYHGRVLVYELLLIDETLAHWIGEGAPRGGVEMLERPGRYVAMREVALQRLRTGQTSREELRRLFGPQFMETLEQPAA
ncbi:MAG: Flp pilus assembly complex ATPase component TadA [Marichromatium sp.]|nr:Flp pilus assembly complex ATPase component TadA [Marichromatium sp.]